MREQLELYFEGYGLDGCAERVRTWIREHMDWRVKDVYYTELLLGGYRAHLFAERIEPASPLVDFFGQWTNG